jgi:hypothetical protein
MSAKTNRLSDRLSPTEIPEEVIRMLMESLKIDATDAVDLIVFMHDELRAAAHADTAKR